MQVKNPQWLHIDDAGGMLYGYDQDWFATSYRRVRGCGPTAAAMLLGYLQQRDGLELSFPGGDRKKAARSMEHAWKYFTPHFALGIYSTRLFCLGAVKLILDNALPMRVKCLSIPLRKSCRPSPRKAAAFIKRGLADDCPVAFLNLQKGACRQLNGWHWTIIMGLEERRGKDFILIYDNGEQKTCVLADWLETSLLGGGFVWLGNV